MIDDASVLVVELSIFRYVEGLSIMSIFRDVTSDKDSLLIIAAADKDELITLSLLVLLTSSPPMPLVNEAPKTMTSLLRFRCCTTIIELVVFFIKLTFILSRDLSSSPIDSVSFEPDDTLEFVIELMYNERASAVAVELAVLLRNMSTCSFYIKRHTKLKQFKYFISYLNFTLLYASAIFQLHLSIIITRYYVR
jgi:hypothetical protein